MHEYSITCSIIEILNDLIKKHKIKKIKKISFELSFLAHIESHSIEFYYNFLTRDNVILKDADLKFRKNKLKIKCKDCKNFFEVENFISKCPECSSSKLNIIDSDDIKIMSIET